MKLEIADLRFKNPVGLAAGLDKNGDYIHELAALGFGFLEVGTVTPLAQPGNPKPRLFRLKKDRALINRMGFNNKGLEHMVIQLSKRPQDIVIGVNIGKNKITPNEDAADDYATCIRKLQGLADYFAINVSSPNTPGLRALQEKESLEKILSKVQKTNKNSTPVFLKIAPDIDDITSDNMVRLAIEYRLTGIIISNTTVKRNLLRTSQTKIEQAGEGGLSGTAGLKTRSDELLGRISKQAGNNLILIGVGGIQSPQDAIQKMKAGATMIQLYTGFIYEGPSLIKKINTRMAGLFSA